MTVLGVSGDTVSKQRKFKEKYDLPYHLLADVDKQMCEAYGVMKEKSMYGKKYLGIVRTTFLLDKDGNIVHTWEDVRPAGHAEEVLAEIQQNS